MNDDGRKCGKLPTDCDDASGRKENWRISEVFRLIEFSVGDDGACIIGHAGVVEYLESGDGHELGEKCIRN